METTILIVEDEFKIADVIASRLRNEQYIVDVYVDGEKITGGWFVGHYGPCGSTHTVTVPAGVFIVKSAVVVLRISLAVAVGSST